MNGYPLRLRRLGIDTYTDPVVYMSVDCHVCRAEGFAARSRVKVALDSRSVIATLNVVQGGLLAADEVSLSEFAWRMLQDEEGGRIHVSHPEPMASESRLRAKVYGERLSRADMDLILGDIVPGLYSDVHLAAFVTAGAGEGLDEAEPWAASVEVYTTQPLDEGLRAAVRGVALAHLERVAERSIRLEQEVLTGFGYGS